MPWGHRGFLPRPGEVLPASIGREAFRMPNGKAVARSGVPCGYRPRRAGVNDQSKAAVPAAGRLPQAAAADPGRPPRQVRPQAGQGQRFVRDRLTRTSSPSQTRRRPKPSWPRMPRTVSVGQSVPITITARMVPAAQRPPEPTATARSTATTKATVRSPSGVLRAATRGSAQGQNSRETAQWPTREPPFADRLCGSATLLTLVVIVFPGELHRRAERFPQSVPLTTDINA